MPDVAQTPVPPKGAVPIQSIPPPPPKGAIPIGRQQPQQSFGQQVGEASAKTGYGAGVFGQMEHPEKQMFSEGYQDIKSGQYQKGLHEMIGGGFELLKPTAGLMGEGGFASAAGILGGGYLGGKAGSYLGPKVGLTPELGGDIGTIIGGSGGVAERVTRGVRETPPPPAGAVPIKEATTQPSRVVGLGDRPTSSAGTASGSASTVGTIAPETPTGTASDRPQVAYKPSEKATTASQPRKIIPEAEDLAFQEDSNRNKAILLNPKATDIEKKVATDRLAEAATVKAGYMGGQPPESAPNRGVPPEAAKPPVPEAKAPEPAKVAGASVEEPKAPSKPPTQDLVLPEFQKSGELERRQAATKARGPADRAWDTRILNRAQAPKEPLQSAEAKTSPGIRPAPTEAATAAPKPVRESKPVEGVGAITGKPQELSREQILAKLPPEEAPKTPAKAPERPVEAAKAEVGPQKPIPKKDPSQAGFFSFRGKQYKGSNAVMDLISDEAKRVTESRRLASGIDDLGSMRQADFLRAKKAMEDVPGSRKAHEEAYHWLENRSLPLSSEASNIVGNHILPLMQENTRIANKLAKAGVPTQVPDYVHRIPLKKNSPAERILLGRKQVGSPVLSQSASALKRRSYESMTDPQTGRRFVVSNTNMNTKVHIKGQVTTLNATKGMLKKKGLQFGTATTKEIEAHTPTQYIKHGFGNTLLSHMELKSAERAHDFLKAYKKTPDFKSASFKEGTGIPPAKWQKVYGLKPLEGHYFEPHTAEVLQRYVKRMEGGESGAFEKLNTFLRNSIFFNPLIHVPNIMNHWGVEKGTRGYLPDNWARMAKTSAQAIDIMMHPTRESVGGKPSYLSMLDEGAPLQGQRRSTREATALLTTKMYTEFARNPSTAAKVADALRYAHPVNMIKGLYKLSGNVTWMIDDFARIQASLERMSREGLSSKEAMKDVSRHIPDYRLPTRIFNSRALGKLMENPNISMFGAYHYGALKSYGEMLKEVVKGNTPDKIKSFNKMAMLGIVAYAIYPQLDKLARSATGDPKAKVRRAGSSTFFDNVEMLAKGKKSPYAAATSVVTPAPLPSIALDAAAKLNRPGPIGKQAGKLGDILTSKVGPVSAVKQSKGDWKKFLWAMLGVRHDSSGEKPTRKPSSSKGKSLGLGSNTLKLPKL